MRTIYDIQKEIAEMIVANNLATTVFICCEVMSGDNGNKSPVYLVGDNEWAYVGVSDNIGRSAYMRSLGDISFQKIGQVSSCGSSQYLVNAPIRIVYFGGDNMGKVAIMSAIVSILGGLGNIVLKGISSEASELLYAEQGRKDIEILPHVYFAIDFFVSFTFVGKSNDCAAIVSQCENLNYKICTAASLQ